MIWVKLDSDIFSGSDIMRVNKLISDLFDSPKNTPFARYSVLIDINSLEEGSDLKNYLDRNPTLASLVQFQFNDFVNNSCKVDYKVNEAGGDYNTEEAIRIFSSPVRIILENNKNDSEFINAIMKYLDGPDKFKCFVDNGWVVFGNAGGCGNVLNFIEGEMRAFETISLANNRNREDYFRGIVILDSDKNHPNDHATKYNNVISELNRMNIPYHITEKRAMENYMPENVIYDLVPTYNVNGIPNWVNAYKNLSSSDQKDYLNIPDGFPKDGAGNVLPLHGDVAALFNIGHANLSYLSIGLKLPNFKDNFPKLFSSSHHVHKTSLNARDGNGELEKIKEKINLLI